MKNLTLIIPAKYESESLPTVLNELKQFECKKIIVLSNDDNETINSINNFQDIEILRQKRPGYGNALIEGIHYCKTEYFCIFNADGSFDPLELNGMYQLLNKYDLVFASRYQKNSGSDDDNLITLIGNYFFTKIGKIFFKLPITDILYTYVMGHTNKTQSLNLSRENFSFCIELPIKAYKKKLKITSSSSFERKRIAGKKKVNAFKDGFIILQNMINLFFNNE